MEKSKPNNTKNKNLKKREEENTYNEYNYDNNGDNDKYNEKTNPSNVLYIMILQKVKPKHKKTNKKKPVNPWAVQYNEAMKFRTLLHNDNCRREKEQIQDENNRILKRLQGTRSTLPHKEFEDEYYRHKKIVNRMHALKYGEYIQFIYLEIVHQRNVIKEIVLFNYI